MKININSIFASISALVFTPKKSLTNAMPKHTLQNRKSLAGKTIVQASDKIPTHIEIRQLQASLKSINDQKIDYQLDCLLLKWELENRPTRFKTTTRTKTELTIKNLEKKVSNSENKVKKAELAFCNTYKKLYSNLARLSIQAHQAKEPQSTLIKECDDAMKELISLWDTSFNKKTQTATSSSTMKWECYEDNWTYWMTQPALAEGLTEDFAFAVVYSDGSFDTDYPIFIPPWSINPTLAIGGWNNSQSTDPSWGTNGFYDLVNGMSGIYSDPYTTMETNFLNSISATLNASGGAWKGVCLDFENYGDDLAATPQKYTQLVKDVYSYLELNHPGVTLKMCMSPNAHNRRYFDMTRLLTDCPNLQFQAMCYDYALGQPYDNDRHIAAIPNAPLVGPSGQEVIASDMRTLFAETPQDRVYLSVPEYGVIYDLVPNDPNAKDASSVTAAINNNWSLKAKDLNYGTSLGNGQITNDETLSRIGGNWNSPTNGWVKIEDNFKYAGTGNIFYYNQATQQLISAYPPDSLNTSIGEFIRKESPNILGVFGWEAIGDSSGGFAGAALKTFMDQFTSSASTLSSTTLGKITRLFQKTICFLRMIGRRLFGSSEMTKLIKTMSSSAAGSEKCYIDMGILYGNWVYNNAIIWWPEPVCIDQTMVDEFLTELFAQFKKDGVTELRYSFAQMSDILNLVNGTSGAWNDTITPIYADGFKVGSTNQNFYEYMTTKVVENGLVNNLSFGGALAGESEMILPQGTTPTESASALVSFMNSTNTNSVDFDIEAEAVNDFANDTNLEFLSELHTQLRAQGKTSSITLVGALTEGPTGPLKPIFDDFDLYFDTVNLMLYSTNQYYLDADNASWGIKQWLACMNNDPSKICIGFFDKIPYQNASANPTQPSPYKVAGLTTGQSAAAIYIQLCEQLSAVTGTTYTVDSFASPFWWTDDPTTLPSDVVLEDFYEYLGAQMMLSGSADDLLKSPEFVKLQNSIDSSKTLERLTYLKKQIHILIAKTKLTKNRLIPTVAIPIPDEPLAVPFPDSKVFPDSAPTATAVLYDSENAKEIKNGLISPSAPPLPALEPLEPSAPAYSEINSNKG